MMTANRSQHGRSRHHSLWNVLLEQCRALTGKLNTSKLKMSSRGSADRVQASDGGTADTDQFDGGTADTDHADEHDEVQAFAGESKETAGGDQGQMSAGETFGTINQHPDNDDFLLHEEIQRTISNTVGPLRLNERALVSYNRLINHRKKLSQASSPAENNKALAEIAQDPGFQHFRETLNIDDLELNRNKDSPVVVELTEGDVLKYLKQELPKRFDFPGHLCRVGTCEDGSMGGQIDRLDTLYVINTNISTENHQGNSYDLYRNGDILKPLALQTRMADVLDECLNGWKWGVHLVAHGGYFSPEFTGVRLNGPAVTVVMVHTERGFGMQERILCLNITVAFSLPINPIFQHMEYNLQRKLDPIDLDDKFLKSDGAHLIPNILADNWQVTTAAMEAWLFRDLSELAPVKRAYSFLKILNDKWQKVNHAEGGLFLRLSLVDDDKTKTVTERIMNCNENYRRTGDNSMRYAHALLPKLTAKKIRECYKSDVCYSNAAIKHILLNLCLRDSKMFSQLQDSAALEDEVYRLVVEVIEVLSTRSPSRPQIHHALLENTFINIYSLAKRTLLNDTHKLLQRVLLEECEMLYRKFKLEKWSYVTEFNTDQNGAIDEGPYWPVHMDNLRYPEYTYEMKVDLSISPNRNTRGPHLLNVVSALVNTCGGVLTIKHGPLESNESFLNWLKRLNKMFEPYELKVTVSALPIKGPRCLITIERKSGSESFPSFPVKSPVSQEPSQEIDIFVKPSTERVCFDIAKGKKISFNILQNGCVTCVSKSESPSPYRFAPVVPEKKEGLDEIPLLAAPPATTQSKTSPATGISSNTEYDVSEVFKRVRILPLMRLHWRPWKDYVKVEPATISERVERMSSIIDLGKPLIVFPDMNICPQDLQPLLEKITSRYRNFTGFGVWFDGYRSVFENLSQTAGNAYFLCFMTDSPILDHFDLWSVRDGSDCTLSVAGREIKWQLVNTLRFIASSCSDFSSSINLTINCHRFGGSRRTYDQSLTHPYPLFEKPVDAKGKQRLRAGFAEMLVRCIKCPAIQHSLVDNLLLSLTLDQSQHLIDFAKFQLNYIEGPPGSGKSLIASYLCEICNQRWDTKARYLCASNALGEFLERKGNCQVRVVHKHTKMKECIYDLKANGKQCLIVDDVQSMVRPKEDWTYMVEEVIKKSVCLYVFADHRYQDYQSNESVHLPDIMSSLASQNYLSYNRTCLSKVHRNSLKVVSFMGAGFQQKGSPSVKSKIRRIFENGCSSQTGSCSDESTVQIPPKIVCGHNEVGDDVHLVQLQNLFVYSRENGLLYYVHTIMKEYQLTKIAIMIDCDHTENYVTRTKDVFKSYLRCNVHGCDRYPRTGLTIDHLDKFVGVDAPVCLFPIIPRKKTDPVRRLENPKYRAFIASRAVLRLVLITEGFDEKICTQFQLDPMEMTRLTSSLDYSSVKVAQQYTGTGDGFIPRNLTVCHPKELVVVSDTNKKIHVLTEDLQQHAVFGGRDPGEWDYQTALGVCISSRGYVYTSDCYKNTVQVTDSAGNVKSVMPGMTGTPTRFSYPCGLAMHYKQVFLCDHNTKRILVMTEDMRYIREFPMPGDRYPWNISVRDNGMGSAVVAVCDREGDLHLMTPEGVLLRTLTHTNSAHECSTLRPGVFGRAVAVAFDAYKNLILTAHSPSSIHVFPRLGMGPALYCITEGLSQPYGVTVMLDHSLLVCDQKVNSSSGYLLKYTVRTQSVDKWWI